MRRGLISWSQEEMPAAVLDARVARLQAAMREQQLGAMREQQLGAVLAYTSFAQPAAVHWLTNFTPYWSEALLVVLPEGKPLLLAALTQRVHPWIREVSHLGDVLTAPRLGHDVVKLLSERLAPDTAIGVIGLDTLPWPVASPLIDSARGTHLTDVSDLFRSIRQPADAAEITLAEHASRIALAALRSIPASPRNASEITAAVESSARLAGAEEVLQRIAPDLHQDTALCRMDGDCPLGTRYAVEVSVAYKGVWVRAATTLSSDSTSKTWHDAQRWFESAAPALAAAKLGKSLADAPGKVSRWSVEASLLTEPLSIAAANGATAAAALPAGCPAVVSVHLALADGPWMASAPCIVGRPTSLYPWTAA